MFLAAIFMVVVFVFRIFHSMGDIRKQFKNMSQQRPYRQGNNYDTDEAIIDQRSPEEANRKIIPKDEGEYVDFKESSD